MESGVEISWEKLRRVEKRGGHSTPAASFWRANQLGLSLNAGCERLHDSSNVSSRKLAAALWDLHHHEVKAVPLDNMRRSGGGGGSVPPPELRRRHSPELLNPPLPTSFHLNQPSRHLRRNVAKSLVQHHRSIEKSHNCAARTVSPSSCSRLVEIAPCIPAASATPSSSIELRTSTELLKVLNRVWSLEEDHASNKSVIKALKRELDHARLQQGGRHDIMDELMKHITGDKLVAKKKEQDRIKRDELNNERKLRKHSESLLRKLAQELYEVKSSLSSICKELEKEKVSRGLVEDLCDELARGVRDCDKESDHDQLILRISQAWLEERMQVKQQQHHGNVGVKNPKLQNERNSEAKINGNQMVRNPMFQKSSLESIPLNLSASARREEEDDDGDGDGDGSSSSHSNCFEVEKTSEYSLKLQGLKKFQDNHFQEILKQEELNKKLESSDWTRSLSPYHQAESPARGWTEKLPAQDPDTSEFTPELKESSTLRAKLSEARSRGQKSCSRQKASIYPSRE